ncbi:MAG: di-trans,poly-cis-decaprenylcistransferase [Xanthomonadales bacterium]|nr:di-trans,poly-cis-decaprenylcistransferase [Xanthomonadales bacterium]
MSIIDPAIAVQRLPRHVAIVMDGNGRWAEARHRPRSFGHHEGVKAVRASVEACIRRHIPTLTLFAFSSENWKRPEEEVGTLMELFMKAMDREVDELVANGVSLRFIGERAAFAAPIRERMDRCEERAPASTRLQLNIAANYGGRWDIVQAARGVARAVAAGELDAARIDESVFDAYTCLADLPPLDLFIRTGGETRVSNFLLWQLAYAELWFSDVLWPDFDAGTLDAALADYARRERRFGGRGASGGAGA